MSGNYLNESDRQYFLKQMRRHKTNALVHQRMNALLLLDDGWSVQRVSEALFLDEGTIRNYQRLYESGGRSGIESLLYVGRSCALSPDELEQLFSWIDETVPTTAQEICHHVHRAFGVSYTRKAMAKLLKRCGYVHKKPKCVPAKADEAVQRAFVDETLTMLLAEASDDKPLYFADATHPSYTGRPAHGWMKKGRRVELASNHGRTRMNINGALNYANCTVLHREEDRITSSAMIRLFDDIATANPQATEIRVVLDNARYNHSKEIKEYLKQKDCRIKLIYLPAYAPNLNLIERFWFFMKKEVLFNKTWPDFATFQEEFRRFFNRLDDYADKLKSLITPKFHFIGVMKN